MKLTKEICDLVWNERTLAIKRFIFFIAGAFLFMILQIILGFMPVYKMSFEEIIILLMFEILIGFLYTMAVFSAGMYAGIVTTSRAIRDERLQE